MFAKTVAKQGMKIIQLERDNVSLYEDKIQLEKQNRALRKDNNKLTLMKYKAKKLAEETIDALENLQEIDRLGNTEESKTQMRNTIINNLRLKNIDIIKELDTSGKLT